MPRTRAPLETGDERFLIGVPCQSYSVTLLLSVARRRCLFCCFSFVFGRFRGTEIFSSGGVIRGRVAARFRVLDLRSVPRTTRRPSTRSNRFCWPIKETKRVKNHSVSVPALAVYYCSREPSERDEGSLLRRAESFQDPRHNALQTKTSTHTHRRGTRFLRHWGGFFLIFKPNLRQQRKPRMNARARTCFSADRLLFASGRLLGPLVCSVGVAAFHSECFGARSAGTRHFRTSVALSGSPIGRILFPAFLLPSSQVRSVRGACLRRGQVQSGSLDESWRVCARFSTETKRTRRKGPVPLSGFARECACVSGVVVCFGRTSEGATHRATLQPDIVLLSCHDILKRPAEPALWKSQRRWCAALDLRSHACG